MAPSSINTASVHFGGPDKPPRLLRDILEARVAAVPAGGWIDWATYYFRDEALAGALIAASRRGVDVRLTVEGEPRRKSANLRVLAMLREGLDPRRLSVKAPLIRRLHPHMHVKLYAFSHPRPHALVGSFNPSGNEPEDPDVIAEIGDQDRGHNMLVEYAEPALVEGLRAEVSRLSAGSLLLRASPAQNRMVRARDTEMFFYPRLVTGVVDRDLDALSQGRVRGAISHLKSGRLAALLCAAARRGVDVELLVHDTERRVPERTIGEMAAAGIRIRRYVHPERLPLHAKFLLVRTAREQVAFFGSFNFNPRSRWLNHELLVRSTDPALIAALDRRFDEIAG